MWSFCIPPQEGVLIQHCLKLFYLITVQLQDETLTLLYIMCCNSQFCHRRKLTQEMEGPSIDPFSCFAYVKVIECQGQYIAPH